MKLILIPLLLMSVQGVAQRIWKAEDFGIIPNTGKCYTNLVKHLIDSAASLPGDTELQMSKGGTYNFSIHIRMWTRDTALRINFLGRVGWTLAPCEKEKPYMVDPPNCNAYLIEIQTLRLLNDSLTKKLQLLLEWQELACPIIENVGVVKTVNGYRLLVNKREMIKPAVRYYKRYKTN